jgi:phage I-like protein
VKSAKAEAMQAWVLGQMHTEIEQQVLAVDDALQQLEDALIEDFDAQQQAAMSAMWGRAREHRDENLAVLDKVSMHVCHATDGTSASNYVPNTTIKDLVDALAKLKTQHSEMEKMEQQMAAGTPGRDWEARVGQMQKLRQQRVHRPRILFTYAVSSRTGASPAHPV